MANLLALRQDAGGILVSVIEGFQPDAERERIVDDLDAIVLWLHIAAVTSLFEDGNPQGFFVNLCRMAENRLRGARTLVRRGLPPPRASDHTALLAAIAAGQLQQAADLARVSATPREAGEYEDQYLWAQIIRGLVTPAALFVVPLIDQLEAKSPDEYGDRCNVARALLARDAEAFEEAFAAAGLGYETWVEARAKDFTTPATRFAPHRFLWLEGLALLRLAERAGIAPPHAPRYCPPLARVRMSATYSGDWAIPDPGAI